MGNMDSRKPLTAGEIEELKALEAKATPGPWAWEFAGDDNTCAVGTVMDENDNFIAGMVGQDADTVVVDSVCPEVTNQQDAAFVAAARNVLPRLLSTFAQAQHEASILSRVIDVMGYEGHIDAIPERLAALLTPPPDAAVKEAVEHLGSAVNSLRCNRRNEDGAVVTLSISDARTLLSAVQAPRLGPSALLPDDFSDSKDWRDGDPAERIEWLKSMLTAMREREAEAWKQGELSPRLTPEQREAVKIAEEFLRMNADEHPADEVVAAQLCLAFPEAFAGEVGNE